MPVGKTRGSKHEMTDPRKKLASTANTDKKKKGFDRGQQLSDKRATAVAKGKMTYEQAMAKDKADDAKKSKITKVGKKVKGSSANTTSKRKYTKAKFKLDKYGNKVAY